MEVTEDIFLSSLFRFISTRGEDLKMSLKPQKILFIVYISYRPDMFLHLI